jgi:hypothetical protein
MSPLDDLPNLDTSEEEVIEPLGLANPLLPPEPLGQEPLYPQFLMPVAAVPLMAANPALFFPEGLPGYQPPDNIFQESPFFIQAREALRPMPIEVLPEVSPRASRPILSELLNELVPSEESEELLESPEIEAELASPLIEELQAPNVEDIPALEELAEVKSTVTSEAIEAEEPLAVLPGIDTSSLSPEVPSNPISSPEETLTADLLPSQSIITIPVAEEAELSPEGALSAIPEEPEISVDLSQAIETSEVSEPEIVAEPPALSTEVTPVAEEIEPLPAGDLSAVPLEPEFPIELPEAVETAEVIEPEITAELPALPIEAEEPVSQEVASSSEIPISFIPPAVTEEEETPEVATDIINPEPEEEETLQAPEPAEVQTVLEETEEPILESPAVENTELLESPVLQEIEVPEEILPIIESSEGAETLLELPSETPEETPPKILETPIPTSEIIPEEQEEAGIVSESSPLEAVAEGAVTTSESAISLPVEITAEAEQSAEAETAETASIEEQLLITEAVLSNIESEEPPPEVTLNVEPIAAEQNVPEEAIAAISEPLAASVQEMAAPIVVEQGLENVLETEVSPLISKRQEFLEEQIEVSSGLESEELGLEEAAFVPENASPEVPQESSANPETEIAETPPLEIPSPVLTPLEASADAPENPLVEEERENLSIPNQSEMLGAQAEEDLEVIPSLPTILENLGILTSLITSPPLTQLSNFLPISSEPFSSGRQMGMPFGLEQPMTFASPNIPRQIITRREENSVAPTVVPEPSLLTTPNPPEPSEQNVSRENQSVENTQEAVKSETIATDETITAEAAVSVRQEELLPSLEEEFQLPIVTAPSVMRSSGNYIPLTFAPRPATRSRSTAQQGRTSSFSTQENIPTEWFSIEELIRGNSSSSGEGLSSSILNPELTNFDSWENILSYDPDRNYISPEGEEEQEYASTAMPLKDSDEEAIGTSEDEEVSLDNIDEDERYEADIEYLAQEIYSMLQQRLAIERERRGYHSGRLPW